ncbi:hypothetical protein [Paenibacillus elgii]|uniref:hypothetical protein n=1 Tax=Paenibacillus elgii TaxID=189691 RepID=UPI000248CB66|nr:hypothetical protein [Paenibacillus elgii]
MKLKIAGSLMLSAMLVFSSSAMAQDSTIDVSKTELFQTSAAALKKHGLTDEVISKLGQDIYPLSNEIQTKNLTKEQMNNYIDGIEKANKQAAKVKENREKGIVDESVQETREVVDGMVTLSNGHKIPVPQRNKGSEDKISPAGATAHGPYYNVDARAGFNQVTHWVDLPGVYSHTHKGIIPYVLGGAYVTNWNNTEYFGGADVGAFYEDGVWRLAINGKSKSGNNYWTNSSATLPGKVYLNYKVSADNQLQIIASDSNYNYITSISYWFPDIYLKADGSNVEMATGFSMAYKYVNSVTDGSYLRGGHISHAYVYGPNSSRLMDESVVVHATKKGTQLEQEKISVYTNLKHYDYYVDINLQ